MLAKMIDKIVSLRETKTFRIGDETYSDRELHRIEPHVDRPRAFTVSGLDGICKLVRQELDRLDTTVFIEAENHREVRVVTTYRDDFSRDALYFAKADAPGLSIGWRDQNRAIIELRSLCLPGEGVDYLLDLLSRITFDDSLELRDNGVSQSVKAQQGVSLASLVNIKPRVMLRPFRTFLEVEQPESEFLVRVDKDKGIGLFEADGGIWKLEAKGNIVRYFEEKLADLVEAGKVIVMQ